jgi:tryptophanyl-tRNA synthetase
MPASTSDSKPEPGQATGLNYILARLTAPGRTRFGRPLRRASERPARRDRWRCGEVKSLLAIVIDAHVAPTRNRYHRLLTDPAQLDARLAKGEQQACQRADRTLARTMAAVGL